MKIIEKFKSITEDERRKAVTDILIKYEEDKHIAREPCKPLKAG
jgi:hypothetical protein